MKNLLKWISEKPFLAFAFVALMSVSFLAAKEYRRIARFAENEVVQLPAGLYVGGNGSDPDPTLYSDNRVTRVLQYQSSANMDAGLFANSTCTGVQPVLAVPGARVGDTCLAAFTTSNVLTWPGIRSDHAHCSVTDAGIVQLQLCSHLNALDAGVNEPVLGKARITVISNQ